MYYLYCRVKVKRFHVGPRRLVGTDRLPNIAISNRANKTLYYIIYNNIFYDEIISYQASFSPRQQWNKYHFYALRGIRTRGDSSSASLLLVSFITCVIRELERFSYVPTHLFQLLNCFLRHDFFVMYLSLKSYFVSLLKSSKTATIEHSL